MKNNWKWFLLVESLLMIFTLYQLVNNVFILGIFVLGSWLLFLGRNQQKRKKRTYLLIGVFLALFALLSLGGVW